MTIRKIADRLWSCESRDPKPTGWAPGIFILEIDKGIWFYTDQDSEWQPCAPTVAQHLALMDRATALELDVEIKAADLAAMRAELVAVKASIADLKKRGPA